MRTARSARLDERRHDRVDLAAAQSMRHMPALAERRGARRYGLPRIFGGTERRAAVPGPMGRSLAARMRQLDSESRRTAETPRGMQCTFQRRFVVVAVQTEINVRDTAATFDGGRFDDDEAGARIRELREMLQVPVGRRAVARAVLTHRRDHETIRLAGLRRSRSARTDGWP